MFSQQKSGIILAAAGIAVFACAFIFWQSALRAPADPLPRELQGKSSFDIGQYYFNQTGDPHGPYDLTKAQYYYERAIGENPKGNKYLWYQSGRIDFINGDFDRALQKFNAQQRYFGDQVPNVYYMMGLTYGYKARQSNDPKDWANAELWFKKAVEYFYQSPWPRVDLAWLYFSEGKYQEMKPLIEEGFAYSGNNPWLMNMYGLALLNTGDKDMAREYFKFASDIASTMTPEEWGTSYPGNDPRAWGQGLAEFKNVLASNLALTLQ